MIKFQSLTPTKLRVLLAAGLFLITAAAVGITYGAEQQLLIIADSVSKTSAEATASRNNIQALQDLKNTLAKLQEVLMRADSIAASSQNYNYQNQIISDLNTYATRSGVTITNIDFAGSTAAGSSSTPSTGGTSSSGTATPTAAAPGGLRTATISVTLKNPVDYKTLLEFFNMLEQSVPKLQISKVNLSKASTGSGVTTDVLSIEVYIR